MNNVQHGASAGGSSLQPPPEKQLAGRSLTETPLSQKDPLLVEDTYASGDPEGMQAAIESSAEAIIEEKRAKQRDLEARPYATERARRLTERDRRLVQAQAEADQERNQLGNEAVRQFAAYAHSRGRTTFTDRLAASSERHIADRERQRAREAWLRGERPTPDVSAVGTTSAAEYNGRQRHLWMPGG